MLSKIIAEKKYIHNIGGSILIYLILTSTSFADPPFIVNSPTTMNAGQWEFYLPTTLDNNDDGTGIQMPFEVDWGVTSNFELELIAPTEANLSDEDISAYGFSDLQTAFLYRFAQETSTHPQIAIEPTLYIPTGNQNQDLGNGTVWAQLPLWIGKSWGSWTSYGGGGYALNPAQGMRNYPFGGGVIQHNFSPKLALGLELYSQAANSNETQAYTLLNFGETYTINQNFSFLGSIGHSIIGEEHLISYIGLYYTPNP